MESYVHSQQVIHLTCVNTASKINLCLSLLGLWPPSRCSYKSILSIFKVSALLWWPYIKQMFQSFLPFAVAPPCPLSVSPQLKPKEASGSGISNCNPPALCPPAKSSYWAQGTVPACDIRSEKSQVPGWAAFFNSWHRLAHQPVSRRGHPTSAVTENPTLNFKHFAEHECRIKVKPTVGLWMCVSLCAAWDHLSTAVLSLTNRNCVFPSYTHSHTGAPC